MSRHLYIDLLFKNPLIYILLAIQLHSEIQIILIVEILECRFYHMIRHYELDFELRFELNLTLFGPCEAYFSPF